MDRLTLFFLFLLSLFLIFQSAHSTPNIPNDILHTLSTSPNQKVDILLSMTKGSPSHALANLKTQTFPTRAARLNAVGAALKTESDFWQKDILDFLDQAKASHSHSFTQLWVSNQVIVRNANLDLVSQLAARSDISRIEQDRLIPAHELFGYEKEVWTATLKRLQLVQPKEDVQWGVAKLEAPLVWANGTNGAGIIVASIDTGVRVSHEALWATYKNDSYSWFSPTVFSEIPNDPYVHGTHTMGTLVGSTNGIGMAYGAQWITCQMCTPEYLGEGVCPYFGLLECGQWTVCPTKFDGTDMNCSEAPHVVANSWGQNWEGDTTWYDAVLDAYTASGIIPVFSMGNEGPDCSTVNYPGWSTSVIAVGATAINDTITMFSSTGPNAAGDIRPDFVAPGDVVISAYSDSDTSYGEMTGTSMSTPHVAGIVTLLLSRNPELTFTQIQSLLKSGVVPVTPTQATCGGITDINYPNNHAGHGLVNAWNSYKELIG